MEHDRRKGKSERRSGWLWMALCCIPMIAVVILVALGYWGSR